MDGRYRPVAVVEACLDRNLRPYCCRRGLLRAGSFIVPEGNGLYMQFETWLVFLVASIGLSLSPGPNGLLALTHGGMHGCRKPSVTILRGPVGVAVVHGFS